MAREPVAKKRRLSPSGNGNSSSVPGFAQWNIEQDYENRPRKTKKKDKNEKLPVKTTEGWKSNERYIEEEQAEEDDQDSFLASDEGELDSGVGGLETLDEPQKPQIPVKEQIRQAKETLAKIAGAISEDPEENIGQLGTLAQLAEAENVTVKKLALGTQLAVFKDIIPGYRIRPLSKDDAAAKVSKDVRKLRDFEQGLLSGYKRYVDTLRKYAAWRGNPDAVSLASVAIACICNLLTSVPHFNQRNDLIALVVRKLSTRKVDGDFEKCRAAVEQVFQEDEEGHSSLELVKELTQIFKTKNFQIHESVLNTFLHLRLLSEFSHKASTTSVDKDQAETDGKARPTKFKKEFRTKRERKRIREKKDIEKEMKVADASVSFEERDKNQSETLKLVFIAYFRILKARIQHLMGAVLEGLAKYSHLINQDFFGDILEALKDLINDAEAVMEHGEDEEFDIDAAVERNVSREALLCTITAFALLQGQQDVAKSASSLSLDLTFFITHLYRTLMPLALNPDIELSAKTAHLQDPNGLGVPIATDSKINVATTTVLLLRSLSGVLLPPTNIKAVPNRRVAAFAKQLMSLSLHLPQKSTTAVLGLLTQVTKVHANKIAALWNTEERKGDGVFNPVSDQVESSNPFASTVWEGELLRHHFDPKVRDAVKSIEKNVVLDGR